MSDVFEVSYVFHCNDVGRLWMVTVDIKRIHSVDIVSLGIEIYILYFLNKIFVYKKSSISLWGICLNVVTATKIKYRMFS
jgi:hypothetical protein